MKINIKLLLTLAVASLSLLNTNCSAMEQSPSSSDGIVAALDEKWVVMRDSILQSFSAVMQEEDKNLAKAQDENGKLQAENRELCEEIERLRKKVLRDDLRAVHDVISNLAEDESFKVLFKSDINIVETLKGLVNSYSIKGDLKEKKLVKILGKSKEYKNLNKDEFLYHFTLHTDDIKNPESAIRGLTFFAVKRNHYDARIYLENLPIVAVGTHKMPPIPSKKVHEQIDYISNNFSQYLSFKLNKSNFGNFAVSVAKFDISKAIDILINKKTNDNKKQLNSLISEFSKISNDSDYKEFHKQCENYFDDTDGIYKYDVLYSFCDDISKGEVLDLTLDK